jgi:hypothetical protein
MTTTTYIKYFETRTASAVVGENFGLAQPMKMSRLQFALSVVSAVSLARGADAHLSCFAHSATWKHFGHIGNSTIGRPYPAVSDEIIQRLGLEEVAR